MAKLRSDRAGERMSGTGARAQAGPPGRVPYGARVIDLLRTWRQRVRRRAELARMDDHMLRDIGFTRARAREECAKPFWRP